MKKLRDEFDSVTIPDASSRKQDKIRDFDYSAWAAVLGHKKEVVENGREKE